MIEVNVDPFFFMEIVGLIPACGEAKRLSPSPCSKEIYPVGLQYSPFFMKTIPKAVSEHLLSYYKAAGIKSVVFVIRKDKTDIPRYFRQREDLEFDFDFLKKESSPDTPHTIDFAYPRIKEKIVALGFPDILIRPENAFHQVLNKLQDNQHLDLALGLFPIKNKSTWDMVAFDRQYVKRIIIKSPDTQLPYGWTIAIWRPSFTAFLHDHLKTTETPAGKEMYVGHVIQAAVDQGLKAGYLLFKDGACIDVGKPEDLAVMYKQGGWNA